MYGRITVPSSGGSDLDKNGAFHDIKKVASILFRPLPPNVRDFTARAEHRLHYDLDGSGQTKFRSFSCLNFNGTHEVVDGVAPFNFASPETGICPFCRAAHKASIDYFANVADADLIEAPPTNLRVPRIGIIEHDNPLDERPDAYPVRYYTDTPPIGAIIPVRFVRLSGNLVNTLVEIESKNKVMGSDRHRMAYPLWHPENGALLSLEYNKDAKKSADYYRLTRLPEKHSALLPDDLADMWSNAYDLDIASYEDFPRFELSKDLFYHNTLAQITAFLAQVHSVWTDDPSRKNAKAQELPLNLLLGDAGRTTVSTRSARGIRVDELPDEPQAAPSRGRRAPPPPADDDFDGDETPAPSSRGRRAPPPPADDDFDGDEVPEPTPSRGRRSPPKQEQDEAPPPSSNRGRRAPPQPAEELDDFDGDEDLPKPAPEPTPSRGRRSPPKQDAAPPPAQSSRGRRSPPPQEDEPDDFDADETPAPTPSRGRRSPPPPPVEEPADLDDDDDLPPPPPRKQSAPLPATNRGRRSPPPPADDYDDLDDEIPF